INSRRLIRSPRRERPCRSLRQSGFAQTFDPPVAILRAPKRKNDIGEIGNPQRGIKLAQPRHELLCFVAEYVATIDDNIPEVDADAELDPLLPGHVGVSPGHAQLNIK